MARVVVIGGGFGGMASAARLAKLGHEVTLLEQLPHLGGALSFVEADGFAWDAGPVTTLLPAVLRDLFRKSGRTLDRELDLVPREVVREHHFADGTSVTLPGGSRGAQIMAIDTLGDGLGERWADHVASYADTWDLLRRNYFERPWRPDVTDKAVTALLASRSTLAKSVKKSFKDSRLREMALHPFVLEGHDPRDVPSWAGLTAYLEQNLGCWTIPGGMAHLTGALTERLATRKVDVRLGLGADDVVVRGERAVAVATAEGEIDAEHVVCAIDPRQLPALAPHVRRTLPAIPPVVCHLGLTGDDIPELPTEAVYHGDPTLVVRTGGRAPEGGRAVTVLGRGLLSEDIAIALARKGLDLRPFIETRVDVSPRSQVEKWRSSPMGVLWQGRNTVRDRLSTRTPVAGVYAAGAHATPGAGLPWVGLSAALVAQEIGGL